MNLKIGDVQETMLIPLSIRANETIRKNPRICDEKAVEIVKSLNIDTSKYDKFASHEGVVARTILFDSSIEEYIKQYPNCVCVNLGCGLDNRFYRVDNGNILWYDIDFADAISVRKKVYQESERVTMIASSVLEDNWTLNIPKDKPAIFIAEGLLMYFSKEQVKKLLHIITKNFSKAILMFELMHPFCAKGSKVHDTVKNTNATFGWGTKSGHELEHLCAGLKLIKEDSFNIISQKYTISGWLFGNLPIIKNFNDRLAIFEWNKN